MLGSNRTCLNRFLHNPNRSHRLQRLPGFSFFTARLRGNGHPDRSAPYYTENHGFILSTNGCISCNWNPTGSVLKKLTFCILPAMALFAACSSPEPTPLSRSAQFTDYPDKLFATFEVSCDGPGARFSKAGKSIYECRSSLPPETTAFLILNYDGYPQSLPQGVRRISSTRNTAGYRVDAELYFLVPQKDGASKKVPVESPELNKELILLYRYFGGTPL